MLTNCKFCIAKTAGFCFGVDRAVKIVYNNIDNRCKVVTLGPIIHNQNVVSDLENRGVRVIESASMAEKDMTVVIRSHGVSEAVYQELEASGCRIIDATCPFVARIHKLARESSSDGYWVWIAGDVNHPEVEGIAGHCKEAPEVFSDLCELKALIERCSDRIGSGKRLAVVAQTTFSTEIWSECRELLKECLPDALVYDTICNATSERQSEAARIASQSDIMIIVGGRHSSNTHKLEAVCSQYCRTFLVENASELYGMDFSGAERIGISAGASTPAYIIKEVQQTMSEILNNEEDFNWVEEMENSLKPIHIGKRVTGVVLSVNATGAFVDLGTKQQGFVPADELSSDSNARAEDTVKVGDVLNLLVLKTNDQEGMVTLSKKKIDSDKSFENISKAYEAGTPVKGIVTNVVKGGIIVNSGGVRVFVPASHATMRRDDNLEELLKKEVEFKIIELQASRHRAVGSIRAVVKEARAAAKEKFYANTNVGDVINGTVRSITDYGVFVDVGGVDGLIRKPDLSWTRIKHPSDVVSVGDSIDVVVKDIDQQTGKIALSYKKDSDNPWKLFTKSYSVGQAIDVKIVSITSFGAFAQIIPGVDGLIHISQISDVRVDNVAEALKVGDTVTVMITDINDEANRVSLSIRAMLSGGPSAEPVDGDKTDEE